VFRAKDRNEALVAGRAVLEKYYFGGCYSLGLEKWQMSYSAGEMGERAEPALDPLLKPHVSPQVLAAAARSDKRNELHATFLRMPRFNMSSSEATALANYFAAVDNAEFPYAYSSSRDRSRLGAMEAEYAKSGQRSEVRGQRSEAPVGMQRLDDAMKIVVNG